MPGEAYTISLKLTPDAKGLAVIERSAARVERAAAAVSEAAAYVPQEQAGPGVAAALVTGLVAGRAGRAMTATRASAAAQVTRRDLAQLASPQAAAAIRRAVEPGMRRAAIGGSRVSAPALAQPQPRMAQPSPSLAQPSPSLAQPQPMSPPRPAPPPPIQFPARHVSATDVHLYRRVD
jgi:hypothetical protein